METTSSGSFRSVFQNRNFRWLWTGQLISNFGDSLTALALFVLLHRITGSTTSLAVLAIVIALPEVLFGLVSGVYVDRWDRRRTLVGVDLVRCGLVLVFMLAAHVELVVLLYTVAFLEASFGAFFNPARSAIIPQLLPAENLMTANALTQISGILLRVIGTAVAAVFLALSDVVWPLFAFDALTFLASALFISRIRHDRAPVSTETERPSHTLGGDLREGLRALVASRVLISVMAATGIAQFGLGAFNVLNVPLVLDVLRVPETWLAAVQFALITAMILSGGLVPMLDRRLSPQRVISLGMIALGLVVLLMATVTHIWQLLLALFLLGGCVTPLSSAESTLVQTEVSDDLRGRVSSVKGMFEQLANLLSMALAGVLADMIGLRETLAGGAAIILLTGIAALVLLRTQPRAVPSEPVLFAVEQTET